MFRAYTVTRYRKLDLIKVEHRQAWVTAAYRYIDSVANEGGRVCSPQVHYMTLLARDVSYLCSTSSSRLNCLPTGVPLVVAPLTEYERKHGGRPSRDTVDPALPALDDDDDYLLMISKPQGVMVALFHSPSQNDDE